MEPPLKRTPKDTSEAVMSMVLPRLSPAELLCCRMVSKDWRDELIPKVAVRLPKFAFISMEPRYFSFSEDGSAHDDLYLPSPSLAAAVRSKGGHESRMATLLCVCNGMALGAIGFAQCGFMRRCIRSMIPFHAPINYFTLLNPASGEFLKIHVPCQYFGMTSHDCYMLAFDARVSFSHFNFLCIRTGFVTPDGGRDYGSYADKSPERAYLYSSHTKKWRPLDCSGIPPPEPVLYFRNECYCFNGVAYTLASNYDDGTLDIGFIKKTIMVFDVAEERLSWITSPSVPHDDDNSWGPRKLSLGEVNNSLYFASHDIGKRFSTWQFDIDQNVWSPAHDINLEIAAPAPLGGSFSFCFHPLEPSKIFVTCFGPHIFIADLKTLQVSLFAEVAESDPPIRFDQIVPFICTKNVKR